MAASKRKPVPSQAVAKFIRAATTPETLTPETVLQELAKQWREAAETCDVVRSPSAASIGRELGACKDTICRHLHELVEGGHVVRVGRHWVPNTQEFLGEK